MTGEQILSPAPAPTRSWFARLGLSGKLLIIGGIFGIVVAFLPLWSISVQMHVSGPFEELLGGIGGGQPAESRETMMVLEHFLGKVGLVGYLAALMLACVLYPPNGLRQKALSLAAIGVGLLVTMSAVWLLVLALDGGSHSNSTAGGLMGMGTMDVTSKISTGIGAILNVVAGLALLAGGVLKAREEKLF